MAKLSAPKGMRDIVGDELLIWQRLERCAAELFAQYGYQEVRLPVLEQQALYQRSLGEDTDVVGKEMYAFTDRNGDQLCLRPEGTAGCVRMGIDKGLLYHQQQRFWYNGPMFRRERQQKGRYRQFHQMGIEALGCDSPALDVELLAMTARLWEQLGLSGLTCEINSLGSVATRTRYRQALIDYFSPIQDALDEQSCRQLHSNPLRILDSKIPQVQALVSKAPVLLDFLADDERERWQWVCAQLDGLGIAYQVNPHLVRGLDYYNDTVFEWTSQQLGAQATVCAGGRYNGLAAQLGGPKTPAMGCAMGCERLVLLLQDQAVSRQKQIVWMCHDPQLWPQLLRWLEQYRSQYPQLSMKMASVTSSAKSQEHQAKCSHADWTILLDAQTREDGQLVFRAFNTQGPVNRRLSIEQCFEQINKELNDE